MLQVAEAPGGYTQVDVVFEKDSKRFLETLPKNRLEPVSDIFQRWKELNDFQRHGGYYTRAPIARKAGEVIARLDEALANISE